MEWRQGGQLRCVCVVDYCVGLNNPPSHPASAGCVTSLLGLGLTYLLSTAPVEVAEPGAAQRLPSGDSVADQEADPLVKGPPVGQEASKLGQLWVAVRVRGPGLTGKQKRRKKQWECADRGGEVIDIFLWVCATLLVVVYRKVLSPRPDQIFRRPTWHSSFPIPCRMWPCPPSLSSTSSCASSRCGKILLVYCLLASGVALQPRPPPTPSFRSPSFTELCRST